MITLNVNPHLYLNWICSFEEKITNLVAIGACPWPRDRVIKCLVISWLSTSCIRLLVGSTPGERTNIRGVCAMESSSTDLRSRTGGSTNLWPRFSTIKFAIQKEILSGRQLRIISIFWNTLQFISHSDTNGVFSGSVAMYLKFSSFERNGFTYLKILIVSV